MQNEAGMDVGPSILFRVSSFLIRNGTFNAQFLFLLWTYPYEEDE